MSFNSMLFVFFFLIFAGVYYLARRNLKFQNIALLIGSYILYGSWNWKLLPLIIVTTIVNYYCGRAIYTTSNQKRRVILLTLAVVTSLGILAYFKYYNFFVENLIALLSGLGITLNLTTLNIILPVGISFYTFQTMSYTIDIYRDHCKPSSNLLNFAVYVAFFPQLVAGPIERASNLLPQIEKKRTLSMEHFHEGLNLVVFGFFKKVVIADNLAVIADAVFKSPQQHAGIGVIIGVLAFGFQIYCDFSGYSNIARGIALWMGIRLMVNFNLPYLSKNPSEFWLRWHISLSSWLRDYLFLPIAYIVMKRFPLNYKGPVKAETVSYSIGIFATMFLGGLWHGASWNFVFWGVFHGLLLIIYRLLKKVKIRTLRKLPWTKPFREFGRWFLCFGLIHVGWVFFRARDLKGAISVFDACGLTVGNLKPQLLASFLLLVLPLFLFQVYRYKRREPMPLLHAPNALRWTAYLLMFYIIIIYGVSDSVEFIYFQF